jgi:hypothetical protein
VRRGRRLRLPSFGPLVEVLLAFVRAHSSIAP